MAEVPIKTRVLEAASLIDNLPADTTAQLALKATIASPTFTGVAAVPTAVTTTNTTQIASTAFVQQEISGIGAITSIVGITGTKAEFDTAVTDGNFAYTGDNISIFTNDSGYTTNVGTVTPSSTDTFTNKTFDANGTGNSISNVDVADLANGTDGELITWSATGTPTTVATGTATHVLTSNGLGAAPTFQAAAVGDALVANPLSQFAATTSSQLAGVISDETGSGLLVFGTSPTLVTPALGTPSALVGTNITGTAAGLTAGSVTTNANLTGDVTSVGNATTIASAAITGKTTVTGVSGDFVLISDTSDTGNLKKVDVADFLGGAGFLWGDTVSGSTGTGLTLVKQSGANYNLDLTTDYDASPALKLTQNFKGTSANFGGIEFWRELDDSNTRQMSGITAYSFGKTSAADYRGALLINAAVNGSGSNRFTFDYLGRVGVGFSSPPDETLIAGSNSIVFANGSTPLAANNHVSLYSNSGTLSVVGNTTVNQFALSVPNSSSAGIAGQIITIGDTQTQAIKCIELDMGTSSQAHVAIEFNGATTAKVCNIATNLTQAGGTSTGTTTKEIRILINGVAYTIEAKSEA